MNNGNEFCVELRGRNLNETFNQLQENKLNNNEQIKNFGYSFDNNNIICNNNENNNRKESNVMNINNNSNNKEKKKIFKKYLFNEKNLEQIKNNNNEENDKNINIINNEEERIKIIVDKSLLTDIKTAFGDNLSKKEYTFNSLNSSLISDFSFTPNEIYSPSNNTPPPSQEHHAPTPYGYPPSHSTQILRLSKKPLKTQDSAFSYINNSTTNLSSSERQPAKCNCKNSNCFKFYCECFANGRFCDNCACVNCQNTIENKDLRTEKYNEIISRNPKALQKINSTKRSWTCKCKNSNCLKKYCDCYQNRRSCTSKCKCVNCFNKNIINNRNNKRIRGIKNKKIKKNEKNDDFSENSIINEEEENNENEVNNEKKNNTEIIRTPKKNNKNYLDKNEIYVYYNNKNEGSTAVMTGKKERKKNNINMNVKSLTTDKKNKNIYTKLQMDNL